MGFKKILSLLLAFAVTLEMVGSGLNAGAANAVDSGKSPVQSGFIECNGVKLEYGIYGDLNAEPLLLLPPNGGDMHSFDGNILPEMAKHFKVIAVSPRGCGNSERGTGQLTFEAMSADLVVFLDTLNIEKTNIFGFSDGGNLGIVFTLEHQDRVSKLVAMGANINPFGSKNLIQLGIVLEFLFLSIAAGLTQNPAIALKRDICGMMVWQPNLKFKDLHAITIPVLNIYGQFDLNKRRHSRMITKSIPGAQELMIMGKSHTDCFDETDTVINPALLKFYGVV